MFKDEVSRRRFLKLLGVSGAAAAAYASGLPFGYALAQNAAPASDVSAKLTIFNFGGDTQQRMYSNAIARFNARYPNVEVEDVYTPTPDWGQYITQLRTRLASGLPLDVIAIAIEGVQATITQDLVLPIDDRIAADPEVQALLDDVDPVLHNALKGADGTTYYLTREWNNMVIHYNPEMFEEAGVPTPADDWTWEQFLDAAKALTRGEGDTKVFGFAIPYFDFGLAPWFNTNGTSKLNADWTGSNLNDPKALESVKFVHSLVHEHGVAPAVEGTDALALFSSRRAAMTGAGRWPFSSYIENDFRSVDINYWPRNESATTVFGSGGWAITKTSQNADLAWELLKDLTSFQTDQEAVAGLTAIPARRSVAELPEFLEFPAHANIFFDSLDDIAPIPAPANFVEVESIFMRHMGSIMANAVTPEQGLEAAHQELSQAMARL